MTLPLSCGGGIERGSKGGKRGLLLLLVVVVVAGMVMLLTTEVVAELALSCAERDYEAAISLLALGRDVRALLDRDREQLEAEGASHVRELMVDGVFTLVDLAEQRQNQLAIRVLQSIEQKFLPIESPMFSCRWPDPVSFAQWGQHFVDPAAWLDQIGLIWVVMLLGITVVVVDLNEGFMQHYTPCSVLHHLIGDDAAAATAELLPLITPRLSSSLRVREVAMVVEADRHFRYTSLTGHLTPRTEEHLARVYRPVPITNAGCETALKPLSSSRVDRMGAAQVAAHVKAHTEPLHTWYQYITEDSLAANRAAKRRRMADVKTPPCLLVATPINTTATPLLSAAIEGADTPNPSPTPTPAPLPNSTPPPSSTTRAAAQAVNTRMLQEQQRRHKRAAAELSITMRFASAETRQRCKATAEEQQLAAKEQANNRAKMATQQLQAIAMYRSMIQPLPQNTLKLNLHQLRQLWGMGSQQGSQQGSQEESRVAQQDELFAEQTFAQVQGKTNGDEMLSASLNDNSARLGGRKILNRS
ncbi:hypothetical protein QJQ45_000011 [Haematococcus lacustris]|nr:hypothetical protein QJQ45_000011 [Haematococcus lacustris]